MYQQCHKYCDFNCKICIALNDCSIIKSMQQRIANKTLQDKNKWYDLFISMTSIDKAQLLVEKSNIFDRISNLFSETWYITQWIYSKSGRS